MLLGVSFLITSVLHNRNHDGEMGECEGKIVRLLGIREVEHNSSHADLGSVYGLDIQGTFALSTSLSLYTQMFEQMRK